MRGYASSAVPVKQTARRAPGAGAVDVGICQHAEGLVLGVQRISRSPVPSMLIVTCGCGCYSL
jgi:hypothetical protein